MKYSTQIKPISYLKANAADIVRQLAEQREPMVITQNGEAKMVIQDVASFEETQETMALLKILALGNRQIEEGKVVPAADVIERLRARKRAWADHALRGSADQKSDTRSRRDSTTTSRTHDSVGNANRVLDRIEKALQSLSTFPERGAHPKGEPWRWAYASTDRRFSSLTD